MAEESLLIHHTTVLHFVQEEEQLSGLWRWIGKALMGKWFAGLLIEDN